MTASSDMVMVAGVAVELRRSGRARRITLRVARADGRVTLTLPLTVSRAEGVAFAQSRADWLTRVYATRPEIPHLGPGTLLPVEGRELVLTTAVVRAARVDGNALLVPASRPGIAIEAFLKHIARDRLARACDRFCAALGRKHQAITLRDTRSRWGSCTHDGRLMFSWRLAMAPPDVLNYVAAHEVAHLARMDHSPAFWAVVKRLMPDYPRHRDWLRQHGAALHAWKFRDA